MINRSSASHTPSFPKEENGKDVKFTANTSFQNWGRTVNSTPAYTFYPKTFAGVCNIITWARANQKKVRAIGYTHTWTNFYPDTNEVLISLLEHNVVNSLPAIHPPLDKSSQLQHIALVGKEFTEQGQLKHLCEIGPATTNEQFRLWAVNAFQKGNTHAWTVPLNVIMVENTFGGTISNMCHGAGYRNQTLSDLVTKMTFVNAIGKLQTIGYDITDSEEKQKEGRELIKSAAGALGMLGIVCSFTVKLDLMSYAQMNPVKTRLALTIPPPDDFKMPDYLPAEIMQGVTAEQLRKAKADFFKRCEDDYAEWFWFPEDADCWVNTWNKDGKREDAKDYPSPFATTVSEVEEYLAGIANESILKVLEPKTQTTFLSEAAMFVLPANQKIVTPLIDALHFRRGIQNMRVQDTEFEIPIPADANGKPDWRLCQRAWWDAVAIFYEWNKKNKVPMRLPLEMRIMGNSNVTLAAQTGNSLGTCSIEVLTIQEGLVDPKDWLAFRQAITDKWASYTDLQGKPLNIRPHWAKQWKDLTIQRAGEARQDMTDYMRNVAYKDAIPTFKKHLDVIAQKGGYDAKALGIFSTPLLDHIIHGAKKPAVSLPVMSVVKTEEKISAELRRSSTAQLQMCLDKAKVAHQAKKDREKVPEVPLEKKACRLLYGVRFWDLPVTTHAKPVVEPVCSVQPKLR